MSVYIVHIGQTTNAYPEPGPALILLARILKFGFPAWLETIKIPEGRQR